MVVFLSWSGFKSQRLAEAMRDWLPNVLQAVKPYFSPDDIAKGTRWSSEIATKLDQVDYGLLFLTRDNLEAPWLMFEAGALSKKVDRARVCPLLFQLEPADIKGPLEQFEATQFQRDDVFRLVKAINALLGEAQLNEGNLVQVFDKWWPDLEMAVTTIEHEGSRLPSEPIRADRELLEEILGLLRSLATRSSEIAVLGGLMSKFSTKLEDDVNQRCWKSLVDVQKASFNDLPYWVWALGKMERLHEAPKEPPDSEEQASTE